MVVRDLVWWKITFFGLKLGQDLENRAAYPHQEFQGVPPGAELFRDDCMPLTGKHFSGVGIIDPSHISRYNQLRQQIV